jgi:hypothetical protein
MVDREAVAGMGKVGGNGLRTRIGIWNIDMIIETDRI